MEESEGWSKKTSSTDPPRTHRANQLPPGLRSLRGHLVQGYKDHVFLTSPRNSLSSSWTLGWSHTVISSILSLKSRRWTWEYKKVWFHLGSALFFTVLVRRLLLSLQQKCNTLSLDCNVSAWTSSCNQMYKISLFFTDDPIQTLFKKVFEIRSAL